MKHAALVRNVVVGTNACVARVVIVKITGGNLAVIRNAAGHLDQAAWAEVSPTELFFSRPHSFHRAFCCARQPSRFDVGLAGMFTAVTRPRIRQNYADSRFRNSKSLG